MKAGDVPGSFLCFGMSSVRSSPVYRSEGQRLPDSGDDKVGLERPIMNRLKNRRVILAESPTGKIGTHHFKTVTDEIAEPPEGHVLLRVILAQIAPAARAVMTSTVGFPSTKVGDGILCAVVGEVIVTSPGAPPVGSIVTSFARWEEYATVPEAQVLPVVPGFPLTYQLGIFGLNGLTA